MSLTTCTILNSPRTERVVMMSRSLSKELQLPSNTKVINLTFGNKTVSAALKLITAGGNAVTLSAPVSAALRIPPRSKCYIKGSGRSLQFGPLIGLLTAVSSGPLPFGARTHFVSELAQAAAGKSVLCVFSPQHVDWSSETVTAYVHNGGAWSRRTVPLPDVIYNRLPSRTVEKSPAMQSFKERFIRRNIPLFNWSFFDKSDVYKLLDGELDVNRYVPESHYSPTTDTIQNMLEKHKFVYLKPTAGSLGIGIYRLTFNPSRGYFARFRRNGNNVLIRFNHFDGLMRLLQQHGIRLQYYVVQQGIRLIEQDNCPIDFRFHMTKNGSNEWIVAAIGAKKAGKGSVTTHVRNGGQLMTPEQVLSRVFPAKSEEVLEKAKEAAIELAEAIERNYSHPLGELGFDLGIDVNEQIWMFEANAKPGRSIFKHPALKAMGKASLTNLVDHCLFLSRFQAGRDD